MNFSHEPKHSYPNGLHPHPSGTGTSMKCVHCGVRRDYWWDGAWRRTYDGGVVAPPCHRKHCECRAALAGEEK